MIKYYTGNILESDVNIICQQVNHQGVMGAGLAKQIKDKYPEVMNSYLDICKLPFEIIRRNGVIAWSTINVDKVIASIFGQEYYGTDRRHTDYFAISRGLETVRLYAESKSYAVAIPHGMGAGLGGGEWNVISAIIHDVFRYSPKLEVYICKLPLDK